MLRIILLISIISSLGAEIKNISEYSDSVELVQKTSSANLYFRDDETFLILSKLKTYLIEDDGIKLVIDISVKDPLINPTLGFEEKQGFNQLASDNLSKIEQGIALFNIIDKNKKAVKYNTYIVRGSTSKRKLNKTKIDLDHLSSETITRVIYVAAVNHQEDSIQLLFNEHLRLKVDLTSQPLFKELFTQAINTQTQRKPLKKLEIDEGLWVKRDLRSKWNLVCTSISKAPEVQIKWCDFLKKHNEYLIIEKMIYSTAGGFDLQGLGAFLANADAPNWPRITFHIQQNANTHMKAGLSAILKDRNDVFYSFQKANGLLGNQSKKYKTVDVKKYLPMKDLFEVPDILTKQNFTPLKIEILNTDENSDYLFELKTAIDFVTQLKKPHEKIHKNLVSLTNHSEDEIAIYAMLAFTKSLNLQIPDKFRAIVNAKVSADRSAAALLAYSYKKNKAFLFMHEILSKPEHPAWRTTVSRLGDLGDGFTLQKMNSLKVEKEKQIILDMEIERIKQRLNTFEVNLDDLKDTKQKEQFMVYEIQNALLNYVYDKDNLLAPHYKTWLKKYILMHDHELITKSLKKITEQTENLPDKEKKTIIQLSFELMKQKN